ncbi:Nn.00g031520.m01.CDS01 [Neocucurbitaria sp. VM-36]
MKISLLFWSTSVIAGPLHHSYSRTPRSVQPSPTRLLDTAFSQTNTSLHELSPPVIALETRADPTTPPEGAVFFNVKDWQWDQTYKNSPDMERVNAAWAMAWELVDSAINQLKKLEDDVVEYENSPSGHLEPNGLPRAPGSRNLAVRRYIALSDPAYTQMFGADRNSIGLIHNTLPKQDAGGRNNNLIYLTAIKKDAKQIDGTDGCKGKEGGKAQAFAAPVSGMKWWEEMTNTVPKWREKGAVAAPPEDAWSINFCEGFFEAQDLTTQLQKLKDGADKSEICNLENLDSTARIVVHEWTHFPFTLWTNKWDASKVLKGDHVGWKQVASRSTKSSKRGHQPTNVGTYSSLNADSYAWFAVYGYMNHLDGCAGVHWNRNPLYTAAECQIDVWPPSEKKKQVKNNWACYVPGDRDDATDIWCKVGHSEDEMDIDLEI